MGGKLTLTIVVADGEDDQVHTKAVNVPETSVRPLLDRAIAALQAERDALESCPYHAQGVR